MLDVAASDVARFQDLFLWFLFIVVSLSQQTWSTVSHYGWLCSIGLLFLFVNLLLFDRSQLCFDLLQIKVKYCWTAVKREVLINIQRSWLDIIIYTFSETLFELLLFLLSRYLAQMNHQFSQASIMKQHRCNSFDEILAHVFEFSMD